METRVTEWRTPQPLCLAIVHSLRIERQKNKVGHVLEAGVLWRDFRAGDHKPQNNDKQGAGAKNTDSHLPSL